MAKRLTPEKLKEIVNRIKPSIVAKVGFFPSARYPDGTPVAYIAAIQEFTERSFMRTTMIEQKQNWADNMRKGARAIIRGSETTESVMEKIGQLAAGDMRKKITQIQSPPLKESTLYARRHRGPKSGKPPTTSTKPLVDTSTMLTHLTNETADQ